MPLDRILPLYVATYVGTVWEHTPVIAGNRINAHNVISLSPWAPIKMSEKSKLAQGFDIEFTTKVK